MKERGWGELIVVSNSSPIPPHCGMASPDASQSFGIALRTFSCEEKGAKRGKREFLSPLHPPFAKGENAKAI